MTREARQGLQHTAIVCHHIIAECRNDQGSPSGIATGHVVPLRGVFPNCRNDQGSPSGIATRSLATSALTLCHRDGFPNPSGVEHLSSSSCSSAILSGRITPRNGLAHIGLVIVPPFKKERPTRFPVGCLYRSSLHQFVSMSGKFLFETGLLRFEVALFLFETGVKPSWGVATLV